MTHKQLQSLLKEYRDMGYTLEVKLNATTEVLQGELARLESSIQSSELPVVDIESEPDITEFCALIDALTYDDDSIEQAPEYAPEAILEPVNATSDIDHEQLGIWVSFIVLMVYEFTRPLASKAINQGWHLLKSSVTKVKAFEYQPVWLTLPSFQ